jgi:hypothetical protein
MIKTVIPVSLLAVACLVGSTQAACGPFESVRIHITDRITDSGAYSVCSTWLSVENEGVNVDGRGAAVGSTLSISTSSEVRAHTRLTVA